MPLFQIHGICQFHVPENIEKERIKKKTQGNQTSLGGLQSPRKGPGTSGGVNLKMDCGFRAR